MPAFEQQRAGFRDSRPLEIHLLSGGLPQSPETGKTRSEKKEGGGFGNGSGSRIRGILRFPSGDER